MAGRREAAAAGDVPSLLLLVLLLYPRPAELVRSRRYLRPPRVHEAALAATAATAAAAPAVPAAADNGALSELQRALAPQCSGDHCWRASV